MKKGTVSCLRGRLASQERCLLSCFYNQTEEWLVNLSARPTGFPGGQPTNYEQFRVSCVVVSQEDVLLSLFGFLSMCFFRVELLLL